MPAAEELAHQVKEFTQPVAEEGLRRFIEYAMRDNPALLWPFVGAGIAVALVAVMRRARGKKIGPDER